MTGQFYRNVKESNLKLSKKRGLLCLVIYLFNIRAQLISSPRSKYAPIDGEWQGSEYAAKGVLHEDGSDGDHVQDDKKASNDPSSPDWCTSRKSVNFRKRRRTFEATNNLLLVVVGHSQEITVPLNQVELDTHENIPSLRFLRWVFPGPAGDRIYSRLLGKDIIIINLEKIAKDLLDSENRSRNYSDRPCLIATELSGFHFLSHS